MASLTILDMAKLESYKGGTVSFSFLFIILIINYYPVKMEFITRAVSEGRLGMGTVGTGGTCSKVFVI